MNDLQLSNLPTDVLVSLKHAINQELRSRRKEDYIERRSNHHEIPLLPPIEYDAAYRSIVEANSSGLLSLPAQIRKGHFRDRTKYLPFLLAQDWSHLFPSKDNQDKNFYVYAHVDPRGKKTTLEALNICLHGDPFYIGKGSLSRAWDMKRNQGHGKRIKQIRDAGFSDASMVEMIKNNLTELESFVTEAKLIYYFGSVYDETIQGCLLNLADHIKPHFLHGMHKLPYRGPGRFRAQIPLFT